MIFSEITNKKFIGLLHSFETMSPLYRNPIIRSLLKTSLTFQTFFLHFNLFLDSKPINRFENTNPCLKE